MLPPFLFRRAALVLAAGVLVAGGACSSSSKPKASAPGSPTRTTTAAATGGLPTLHVNVTAVDDNGTKGPDEATVAAVKATLDRWLADAVVGPLHAGKPAGDLSPIFTAAALERLADPSVRSTFVDEGMPPATTAITPEKLEVTLSSVAGPDEVVAMVAARLDLKLRAVGPTSDVDVVHQGEVVLVPDGDGWKIDSFAVRASRDSREATP
ncbi:MAG: hypothetical protein QOF60_2896 [Actinomycetota bacterium]|nr:hypothetical protein [Actinomycetota bacterium]